MAAAAARAWRMPLWAHAGALALVLLALLPVMGPGRTFSSDEGAYALQARALEQRSWQYDYRAGRFDPDGRWFPIINHTRSDDAFYVYVQHPVYPAVLRVTSGVFGRTVGLYLVPLAGALATAVAAWLLAGFWNPRFSRPAFWIAVASPVLINGQLLWAHAPSAALAGLSLVGAVHLARHRLAALPLALTAAGLAAGVLLRSEGAFFVAAVAVAVAAVRFLRDGNAPRALLILAALGGPAAVALLAERAWVRSIVGDGYQNLRVRGGTDSYVSGRITGAWHELSQGHYNEVQASLPAMLAMGLAVGLAYIALRRLGGGWRRNLAMAAALGAALYAIRFAVYPAETIPGLFAAWPLALLGLLLARWRDGDAATRAVGITLALFTAAVVVTQYPEGGGFEWGGRFFSPVIAPLAAIAAVAIGSRVIRLAEGRDRAVATALVAALALAPAVVGVATVVTVRSRQDAIVAAVGRHPADVTVTTEAGLPRVGWRLDDRVTWMLTETDELPELLSSVRAQGAESVAVVTETSTPLTDLDGYTVARPVDERDLDDEGLKLVMLSP